jgi:CRP-like cAMP-binding protein
MTNGIQNLKNYVIEEKGYADKALIIEEGCKFHSVYVVLEGQVKVRKKTPKGSLVLETLKEGAIVGEICLLLEDSGSTTAGVAADGEVRMGVLDTERILADYRSLDQNARELLNSTMNSLVQANEFLATLSLPAD